MPRRLALERFDRPDTVAAVPGDAPPAVADAPAAVSTPAAMAIGAEPPEPEVPAPDAGEPPDETPAPPSPEAEAAAAAARLAAAVEALVHRAGDAAALQQAAERDAAARFGRAAAEAVPHLARTGFPGEVAAASLAIARSGGLRGLTLRLAPEEQAAVAALLADHDRPGAGGPAVVALPDPAVPPGRAELAWADGGAEFDAGRLAEAALACLGAALGPADGPPTPDPSAGPSPDPAPAEEERRE
ncbi:hypothetical protein LNKW23_28620 [Paralimibaculum aggregatum]|uniref:Flagellar assembly protein FliH/Type III secretion system HrpE domain-containing protein n=1 Tax=Paralimibaculum aggregatum TaxID=3036245 RepID=A0ABQ6LMW2_9RHOB|nr:hypothetical protein [Limibaculum sp. NKW23]GMG83649.1 hypothetical protein LNKW23_28620 [Limibaculum sp. NKW23]